MLVVDTFSTHDLWLASFMRSRGMRLVRTTRTANRVTFEFEDKEGCEQLEIEYLNGGKADVSALKMAWNHLKTLIFDR